MRHLEINPEEEILVRNYEILQPYLALGEDILGYYKLKNTSRNLIIFLINKFNSYNAYIQFNRNDFPASRRAFYRAVDVLEEQNIITVVKRQTNQMDDYQVYFTTSFISRICGTEFLYKYRKWFKWQKSFKKVNKNRKSL